MNLSLADIATPEYRVEHDSSEGIVPFDITFTFPSFLTLLRATDALRYISGYTLKEESQEARPAREFDPSTGKWQVRFSLDVVADADSGDSSQLMGSISVFDPSGYVSRASPFLSSGFCVISYTISLSFLVHVHGLLLLSESVRQIPADQDFF